MVGLPHGLAPIFDALAALSLLLGLVCLVLDVACLVQQYRRGGPLTRQQTLVFGVAFLPPVGCLGGESSDSARPWLFGLCTLPLPDGGRRRGASSAGCTTCRGPSTRSLTYLALSAAMAALYAVIVGGHRRAAPRGAAPAWLPWAAAGWSRRSASHHCATLCSARAPG